MNTNKIVVIGAGSFGTALAQLLSCNNSVYVIARNNNIAKEINENHKNIDYFPNTNLNQNIKATVDFDIIKDANFIILAIPSHAVLTTLEDIKHNLNEDIILINTAKGFAASGKNILGELISVHNKSVSILGPTFANNLIKGEYSGFTVASSNKYGEFDKLKELFKDTNVLLDYSTNVKAIEMASILKNVFAISMGLYDSIDDSINTKFLFFTQCFKEMTLLLSSFGLSSDDYSKYAVFGDLLLTSLNDQSRNKTFGQLIGRGFYTAGHNKKVLFEGERSVKYIYEYAKENNLNLPVVTFVKEVLDGENILNSYTRCVNSI
jgi:glycerol-3-phosphate dehydrogenase (NAD(P)+)